MARIKKYDLKAVVFDFTKARVRSSVDGKTFRIEDKFGLYYILKHIDYYRFLYADIVMTYQELKEVLLKELQEAKYDNVVIITDENEQ